jgi:hypothetical protein
MAVAIPIAAVAYASIATAAVGTAASIYASEKSAAAQQQTADYNAQVAKNNAVLAGKNSLTATEQADAQVQKEYTISTQQQGAARVAMAANGIQLNSGSALQVQGDLARVGQKNVQGAQYGGDVNSVGYLNQELNDQSQSGLAIASGQQDAQAGNISAVGDFISGASGVSSKWSSYQQNGAI